MNNTAKQVDELLAQLTEQVQKMDKRDQNGELEALHTLLSVILNPEDRQAFSRGFVLAELAFKANQLRNSEPWDTRGPRIQAVQVR
jgi:hypothetical protein